jgi:enoyl-CoA hydratase
MVLTGSQKAFAAGADIKEMSAKSYMDMHYKDWFNRWDSIAKIRTPIIAAVSGFALGGCCELAMLCDFILASDTAKFGQPEIKLGVMPGIGGWQRLTRASAKRASDDARLADARASLIATSRNSRSPGINAS